MQAVFISIEHHYDPEFLEAKQKELENWTNFGVYNDVDDQGQRTISTKLVVLERELSDGSNCVKASIRLVIRGFEESEKGPVDSPKASKSSMRIFFAVCANNNWHIETSAIKAEFLQGKQLKGTGRGKERKDYLEIE